MREDNSSHPIILFDGVCNLCNGFVQFVITRDKRDVFRFGSLQSSKAQELLKRVEPDSNGFTTIILLEGEKISTESDAVLRIAQGLGGAWKLFYVFIFVPKTFRDGLYRIVSRMRYRVFGKRESCMVPTPDLINKFI